MDGPTTLLSDAAVGHGDLCACAERSVTSRDRRAWDRLYRDGAEGYDYFRACELAPTGMFEFSAMAVADADSNRLVAGGPLFSTDFRMDLALDGAMQRAARWVDGRVSGLNRVRVIGLGSPHADELGLGFSPELDTGQRRTAFDVLLGGLAARADDVGAALMAFKNVNDAESIEFADLFRKHGYARIATLPISKLAIPTSIDAYIDGLSANMRSNLRRRLKRAARLKLEIRKGGDSISDVAAELFELREFTLRRASTDYDAFGEVSPDYFGRVMEQCGDKARLLLYRLDGRLIAFSLVLLEPRRLKEKYTGMRYPDGPDNGAFYLNWVTLIRLCIEHGIPQLHSGETTYLIKARLGCKFHRSWIYFRHRRPVVNALFGFGSRYVSLAAGDPDLKELGATAPYVDACT